MSILPGKILICCLLFVVVNAGVVPTENGCPGGTVHEVRITDCTAYPCKLRKGKEYVGEVDFTPSKNTSTFNARCTSTLYGQTYVFQEEKLCPDISSEGGQGQGCPLNIFTKYTYKIKFAVVYWVPNGLYPFKCTVLDDTKSEQMCLSVSGLVVN